jgi:hypothetical protein
MTPWMIALAFYSAVGLALIFVGPTARLFRREREKLEWQAHDQPRWKLVAFSCLVALAIFLLWPVLVVSAARIEAPTKIDLLVPRSVKPSAKLNRLVSKVHKQYAGRLPLEAYREIVSKLPWTDHEHSTSGLRSWAARSPVTPQALRVRFLCSEWECPLP